MRTTNLFLIGFLLIVCTHSSPIRKREESSVTTSRTPDLENTTSSGIRNLTSYGNKNRTVSNLFTTRRVPITTAESSESFDTKKKDEKKKDKKKKRIPNHGETFDWANFNEKESPTKLSPERNYLVTVVFVFYLCAFFF
ncbi:hypothetical protein B9Z55_027739 [Caenorhabditis nigoni]|uniref:Uncharacterized protein n=1 Tax=Caenorhabditis nigoni TaxID=1611254 RepID=A0A2G5SE10_9PELO|nr:hypothetical protein B9Z55_027739 [Caenorhabditis nigoni]